MTYEQRLERNDQGIILTDKLVRTDGVSTSATPQVSRAIASQLLISASQSPQALSVEVKIVTAPLF